jgi:hypothetical protein
MGLNLNCLLDGAVHVSGFIGEDAGVSELDMVYQVYTVPCHTQLVQKISSFTPMIKWPVCPM